MRGKKASKSELEIVSLCRGVSCTRYVTGEQVFVRDQVSSLFAFFSLVIARDFPPVMTIVTGMA